VGLFLFIGIIKKIFSPGRNSKAFIGALGHKHYPRSTNTVPLAARKAASCSPNPTDSLPPANRTFLLMPGEQAGESTGFAVLISGNRTILSTEVMRMVPGADH
jgi:hypothetical protein